MAYKSCGLYRKCIAILMCMTATWNNKKLPIGEGPIYFLLKDPTDRIDRGPHNFSCREICMEQVEVQNLNPNSFVLANGLVKRSH